MRLSFTLVIGLFCQIVPVLGLSDNLKPLPQNCRENCATPYGKELGRTAEGVAAFSNCQSACVFEQAHLEAGTYTGIEWQCVEYARRWLLKNKQSVFASVDFAFEIWSKISHLTRVTDKAEIPLNNWPNGSEQPPQAGDLLVYSQEFAGTGHVAIVTRVDRSNNKIYVAEQNNRNEPWPANYAREVSYLKRGKSYWLLDTYLIGWKSLATGGGK